MLYRDYAGIVFPRSLLTTSKSRTQELWVNDRVWVVLSPEN